jgi:hypothetical protein
MSRWIVFLLVGLAACSAPGAGAQLIVRSLLPDANVARARRTVTLTVLVENASPAPLSVRVVLTAPHGVTVAPAAAQAVRIAAADTARVAWRVNATQPGEQRFGVAAGAAKAELKLLFLPALATRKLPTIPEPKPVKTTMLIGAHNCPLWEADRPGMWANILKHPERTPALGFYAQENPEVADWETKWAVEHGVSFFIYCWYRDGQGGPVKMSFGSAIHDSLFKSRFRSKMKYTIMWENQARGQAGVSSEQDLMQNLLPFWMENYFKDPGYLKVDNKPVLYVYRPEFLVDDLGGIGQVRAAFDKMRDACRAAGFDGLYLLGEYRGLDPKHLTLLKSLGLDYVFAYCWYVPNNPTPQQSIDTQMGYIRKTQELGILPQVPTVSQAWSGWADEGTVWKIPPKDFGRLLTQARDFAQTLPKEELGSRMLLLDNWNEWGEGHYIAPYREYGFGYLDAVRDVFAPGAGPHQDLLPEDIGMGPYDKPYKAIRVREEAARKAASKLVRKPGWDEPDLAAWWSFDEPAGADALLDSSGHRLGGQMVKAKRAPGIAGSAMVCSGGWGLIPPSPSLSFTAGLTVSCWVKSAEAKQGNTWVVNRVYSGGTDTGYRLGVVDGKPCFEVPLTSFSHHLSAPQDLPTDRWTHLAGTFDGKVMRLYVDGVEAAAMERPGPAKANDFHICLGNYEVDHKAYFRGLLDEVKLHSRALTTEEVRKHAGQYR